jgi:hypothetical protein
MTGLLTYAAIGVLFLLLSALIFRQSQIWESTASEADIDPVQGLCDERFLALGLLIFSSTDYNWLRDDLALPHLALSLTQSRRRIALRWLSGLRAAFNCRIVTVHHVSSENGFGKSIPDRYFLWRTVFFYLVWAYAWTVVFVFGPDRRLTPSFDWKLFIPRYIPRGSPHDAVR